MIEDITDIVKLELKNFQVIGRVRTLVRNPFSGADVGNGPYYEHTKEGEAI